MKRHCPPADFDLRKDTKVMIVCARVNNAHERQAGNFRSFNTFGRSCGSSSRADTQRIPQQVDVALTWFNETK